MNVFYQTLLPAYTPEIDNNAIEFVVEQPFKILISEKEYSELKCEIGYWQAMHKKAICREEKLKQTIKEQEGTIRDLRNRVFGKKSEKKLPAKTKANQNLISSNALVVNNPAVRGMGSLYYNFCLIGGMPEVVQEWVNTKNIKSCIKLHQETACL